MRCLNECETLQYSSVSNISMNRYDDVYKSFVYLLL